MVNVVFSKESQNASFAYMEKTEASSSFGHDHKNIELGLKLGGRKGRKHGSIGFHFQKVLDKVSISANYTHERTGEYKKFRDGFYQILRKITTTVYIGIEEASLIEEKYVNVFPINEDDWEPEVWKEYFKNQSITYIQDHFGAKLDEIDRSFDGATYGQAFCSLGNNT